jgi:two-component system LytT family sensor kinase
MMEGVNESFLVNTLGHSAGVVLFGIFLYLLIQDRAARRLRGSTKSMLAAALALAWNLASLLVLGSGSGSASGGGMFSGLMAALGFSVLSLLPAVLFDLSVPTRYRPLARAGYAMSIVAIGLHVLELFRLEFFGEGERFHYWGLLLITVGFGTLTAVAAIGSLVRRDGVNRATTSRLVATMSLFLLAMSFVHFGNGHGTQLWSQELAFHHAAIPLALLILLQDYRFVLLDAFLRFLANVALAAVFTAGIFQIRRFPSWPAGPYGQALELVTVCLGLILFALFRGRLQTLLTQMIFRTPDLEGQLRSVKYPLQDEAEYLRTAATTIGAAMGTDATISGADVAISGADVAISGADQAISECSALTDLDLHRPMLASELPRNHPALEQLYMEARGIEAVVPIRLPAGTAHYILLGRRSGGRRYLSEDLQALARGAAIVVDQLERFRESETRRLVAQAELRALQSQIHPHFLFNALNALYGIIPREAKGARETVLNLADIFRYFLETRKAFLPLAEELHIVRAYLAVERLRLGGKLSVEIDVDPDALAIEIPVLSLQPLVENAVKHGIAPKPEGGCVRIEARLNPSGQLRVTVSDTGAGFASGAVKLGVGLDNVRRRLELCYGPAAALQIEPDKIKPNADGCTVSFSIPVSHTTERAAAGALS